jgi:hypothetical protein
MSLHPRILASNEARLEAEYKERHHVRWRDVPFMLILGGICIAFPFVYRLFVTSLFLTGLGLSVLVLKQMRRDRRVAPHRVTWWDWVVLCYLIATSLWVVIGGCVSALRHFGLI